MSRTNYSAYMAIKNKIMEIFRSETFEKNKLPSEAALANRLGISLVTLRESLMMLALEGYITKRHGSGNYVHPSTLDYENRIYCYTEYLHKKGYHAGIQLFAQEWTPANQREAEMLGVQEGERLLVNRLVYLADEHPAIYTIHRIPARLLIREDVAQMPFAQIHILIRDYMGRELAHALNDYQPIAAQGTYAQRLALAEETPILSNHQVFYDISDQELVYSTNYFHPEYYQLRTLQNWDLGR
ncbi:MAG TPA: GntR family transcriptional regulator [Candidatus Flavonifractor merdigallinarum]|uniref:GntR family transcriptional regulator n=1 Tax=Candidatus Flavonifractor merdigallinarum TaxID=2838589 RepID=A0A9D2BZF9_9FIRM|nr:GntR family transcriptional regulator [Candidatus Flavonifractor merdigallinarum]